MIWDQCPVEPHGSHLGAPGVGLKLPYDAGTLVVETATGNHGVVEQLIAYGASQLVGHVLGEHCCGGRGDGG